MYKKDDNVTLAITDLGTDGEGIGKVDGYTVFVKDAIVGDTVEAKIIKAKKNYAYGRLISVIKPSPDRVQPKCPVARACGGCNLQHMDYRAQLRFKEQLVRGNLEHIGGITEYEFFPIIGMDNPYNYRNKAQYPVGKNRSGDTVIGFYAGRTHSIIPNTDCCIGAPQNAGILAIIKKYLDKNKVEPYHEETHTGLVRHILIRTGFATGQIMVCLVINGSKLPNESELIDALSGFAGMTSIMLNENCQRTNVILGDKVRTLWGKSYIEDYIGDILFRISPLSFFQINPSQTRILYEKALEFAALTGNETVWDMYCGIGTISLFLARHAKQVYGVEIVWQAIDDARQNAALNNITNVQFFVGKAEEVVPKVYGEADRGSNMANPDVIVVDPPRKGCDEALLATIAAMSPQRVIYVSCDSATLARDLKYLTAKGYQVAKVQPVDQFGHSVHVECVVLLSKVQK